MSMNRPKEHANQVHGLCYVYINEHGIEEWYDYPEQGEVVLERLAKYPGTTASVQLRTFDPEA